MSLRLFVTLLTFQRPNLATRTFINHKIQLILISTGSWSPLKTRPWRDLDTLTVLMYAGQDSTQSDLSMISPLRSAQLGLCLNNDD